MPVLFLFLSCYKNSEKTIGDDLDDRNNSKQFSGNEYMGSNNCSNKRIRRNFSSKNTLEHETKKEAGVMPVSFLCYKNSEENKTN
jgi:hypothetical protein